MLAGVFTSAFAGKGTSRTDAIDFDLKNETLKQGNASLWYKMDLSGFSNDEAIQLVVSNQSGDDVNITATVYVDAEVATPSASSSQTIPVAKEGEGTSSKNVTLPAGIQAVYKQVYLLMASSDAIALSANAVATPEGVGCKFPVPMAYQTATKDWAPVNLTANDPKVLRVDGLQKLKAEPVDMDTRKAYGLKVTIYNNNGSDATVKAGLMLTCGAVLQDMSRTVPANDSKSATIKYSMVQQLTADSVFVDIESDLDVVVKIEAEQQDVKVSNGAKYAIHADFDTPYATTKAMSPSDSTNGGAKKHWFRIFVKEGESRAAKMSKDSVMKIIYTNNSSTPLEISENYKYSSDPAKVLSEDKYKVAAHGTTSHSLSSTQIRQLKVDSIFYYIDADKSGDFTVEWKLEPAEPGSICRTAVGYTLPNNTSDVISIKHKSANTVWYMIDYASAMAINNGAIKLSIKNNSAVAGTLSADIKFDCDGAATPQSKGISAGQTLSKTIGHALLESFSGNGTAVYVGLSTDLNVTISAQLVEEALSEDRACLDAQNITLKADANSVFNFTPKVEGKADTAWYYIDLQAIKDNPKDLKVTLTGTGSIKVDGALAFSCPATSMQEKSLSFTNKHEKTVAYSQIQSLKNPYVRIISTKAVAVLLEPQDAETHVIALCDDANVVDVEPINNDPHSITANYDSAWFHVNVKALRDSLKTNRVYVVYTSPAQTVSAGSSAVCDIQYALSYQNQSLVNGTNHKSEITADRLDLVGEADELWVNVKAEQAYKFELLFEPIPAGVDCEHAEEFQAGKLYSQKGGEVKWFKVDVKALQSAGKNATLTLTNADSKTAALKGVVYNACGGTELGSQKVSLAAGDVKVKTAGLSGYPDLVYMYVEATADVTYIVNLVNETGEDCSEAILFDWDNGYTVAGGSEVWLNVKFDAVQPGDSIVIHAENLSQSVAKLNAGVAYSCADGISQSGSRNLAVKEDLKRDVTSMIGSRDSILIHVGADQAVKLWAEVIKRDSLDEPIVACAAFTPVTYNKWYDVVPSNPEQWFLVSVKDLKENTIGDGTFRIQSDNNVNFKAEVSYECPVWFPMTSKTLNVTGGVEYTRAVSRSDINSLTNDSVYIRVTCDQPAKFQLEIQDLAGFDCERAIFYEWGQTFENPAFATKWYKVPFVDIIKNPEVGVKFFFEKPETTDSIDVDIHIFGSCDGGSVLDSAMRLGKEAYTKEKYINHERVEGLADGINLDTIYISLFAKSTLNFSAIPYAEVNKIDSTMYCPGDVIELVDEEKGALSYKIEDVMARPDASDAILGHKIWVESYPFWYADSTKKVMVDVDSVYHFQGNMLEAPDFQAQVEAVAVQPILLNGEVKADFVDAELPTWISDWNSSDDVDNDYYVAHVKDFKWVKKSDNEVTLRLATDCDTVLVDLTVTAYDDQKTYADTASCQAVKNDTVAHLIPGYESFGYAWNEVVIYNNSNPDPFDDSKLGLSVYPYLLHGVVMGVAEANLDAQDKVDAYNLTLADDDANRVDAVLGWDATGDTLRLVTLGGCDVKIYHAPEEIAADIILPALDSVVCGDVVVEPDTVATTPVPGLDDQFIYTIQPYNRIVLNTIEKATFAPTLNVVVGLHAEGDPSVDYAAALAEFTTFLAGWNLDPANSPVAPENVNFAVDPVNYTGTLTVKDNCDSVLTLNYIADLYEVKHDTLRVLDCEAKAEEISPAVALPIAGSTATFDSVHHVIYDVYAKVSSATPSFNNVKVGELADGTLTNDGAALLAEIATFITEWNSDAAHSQIAVVPAQLEAITNTEAQVTLKDACDSVLLITVPVDFHALVRDTAWSYDCEASSTPDTTNLVLSGAASYDSIHVKEVLAFTHVVAPEITGVEAFCGVELALDDVKAAVEADIKAQAGEGVAPLNEGAIVWTYPAAAEILYGGNITVSYTVTDSCGVADTKSVSVEVKEPEYDEQTVGLTVPMLVDYKGLIVVNKIPLEDAIKAKFNAAVVIEPAMIHWFKVGQDAELTAADGAKGLYFTPQSEAAFEGFDATQYYITLEISIAGGDNCISTFTSVPVVGTTSAPKMFIAPNAVNPGEMITLYNLDGMEAVISVYDMMGVLVANETISGVSSYTFEAQNNAGYYVVKVINGEKVESLKYVVK